MHLFTGIYEAIVLNSTSWCKLAAYISKSTLQKVNTRQASRVLVHLHNTLAFSRWYMLTALASATLSSCVCLPMSARVPGNKELCEENIVLTYLWHNF